MSTLAVILLPGAVLIVFVVYRARHSKTVNFPPGPPADPIIGHLRALADKKQEDAFHELSRTYGDVVYLHVLGKQILVLSSEVAAKDLLDKRGAHYSSRPPLHSVIEIGWGELLSGMPYSGRYTQRRRLAQQPFANHMIPKYKDIQIREVNGLLGKLLDDPTKFVRHLHMMNSCIMTDITYGHRIVSEDDKYLKLVDRITSSASAVTKATLFEVFPYLLRAPAWLPIPDRKLLSYIRETRHILEHDMLFPIEKVYHQMAAGEATPSLAKMHLEELNVPPEERHESEGYNDIKLTTYTIIAGGTETTWSTLLVFVACMVLHPEVQKKAHEEIHRVVGDSRLPDFTDRDSLPYVNAIMQEVMRRYPATPLGIPHYSNQDDVYRGMFIPKGTMVIANQQSMALDENVYKDAHAFKPERFLPQPVGSGEPFSVNIVWGFGRRICPGQHLADTNIWLTIARMLAVFEFSKAQDEYGKDIEIELEFLTGTISYPAPFKCNIRPKSDKTAALIQEALEVASSL